MHNYKYINTMCAHIYTHTHIQFIVYTYISNWENTKGEVKWDDFYMCKIKRAGGETPCNTTTTTTITYTIKIIIIIINMPLTISLRGKRVFFSWQMTARRRRIVCHRRPLFVTFLFSLFYFLVLSFLHNFFHKYYTSNNDYYNAFNSCKHTLNSLYFSYF